MLANTLLIHSATREIPAGSSWGSSWGSSIFSPSETPKQVISCRRKVLIKSDIFEITPKITPKITPRSLQVVFRVLCLLTYPCISKFPFINGRGAVDFIPGGGLLIQGGGYY